MQCWTTDFDLAAAHYWYCADYHAGQWDRLYALLSTHPYRPGILVSGIRDEPEPVQDIYRALVARDGRPSPEGL